MSGTMEAACGEEDSGTEPNPAKGGPFAPFNVSVSCCVSGLLNSVPVFDSVAAPAFWGLARFAVVDGATENTVAPSTTANLARPQKAGAATESNTGTEFSNPLTQQLTETLKGANGPPLAGFGSVPESSSPHAASIVPDMRLVDQDLSRLAGQVFYLDFDGASGVRYNGPVRVEDVQVDRFKAPGEFIGQEDAII